MKMSPEELAKAAIKQALKALRNRHLVEEGAHTPAFTALSMSLASQGSEWKEKAETCQLELQQCYRAQTHMHEQLVVELEESRALKKLVQDKEAVIGDLQKEFTHARQECSQIKDVLKDKLKALDLVLNENQTLRVQLEEMIQKAKSAEKENKMLIDRWMLKKMQEAERLNEANILYEDMMDQLKAGSIEQLARQQVDGLVHQYEAGAENYARSTVPTSCRHKILGHEGGCGSVMFKYNSDKLVTGGQDHTIKIWDTKTGILSRTFYGCTGSILDLTISHDSKSIVAASSSNNLFVWDVGTGRIRHTLTGHIDKACSVGMSKSSCFLVASAAYDRTIKVWDLQKGCCINTIITHSKCNALCFSADGQTICSGHVDGNLRLWSAQSGRLLSEVSAHSQAITSICLSGSGNIVLTSGKDNLHNLFDVRSLEVCGSLRANTNRVTSYCSQSCISSDENYVAAGYSDGSVYIWSRSRKGILSTLKEDTSPILSCSWSGLGKPLASANKNGTVCIWS